MLLMYPSKACSCWSTCLQGRDPKGNGVSPPLVVLVVLIICLVPGWTVELVSKYPMALSVQPGDKADVGGTAGGGEDGLHILGMDSRVYEVVDGGEIGPLHPRDIVIPLEGAPATLIFFQQIFSLYKQQKSSSLGLCSDLMQF